MQQWRVTAPRVGSGLPTLWKPRESEEGREGGREGRLVRCVKASVGLFGSEKKRNNPSLPPSLPPHLQYKTARRGGNSSLAPLLSPFGGPFDKSFPLPCLGRILPNTRHTDDREWGIPVYTDGGREGGNEKIVSSRFP